MDDEASSMDDEASSMDDEASSMDDEAPSMDDEASSTDGSAPSTDDLASLVDGVMAQMVCVLNLMGYTTEHVGGTKALTGFVMPLFVGVMASIGYALPPDK